MALGDAGIGEEIVDVADGEDGMRELCPNGDVAVGVMDLILILGG